MSLAATPPRRLAVRSEVDNWIAQQHGKQVENAPAKPDGRRHSKRKLKTKETTQGR